MKKTTKEGGEQTWYVPDSLVMPKSVTEGTHARREITLACGNVLQFKVNPPAMHEQVWCAKHRDYEERVA